MAQVLETIISINAQTGNGFSKVGATLTELGSIISGLSTKLIDFGKESIEVYRNYELSMQDAEVALSTTYGQNTMQLQTVMDQLDESATEWAASTIFHTNDVANAISEAAHAGWDYDQIMAGIPAAMQLAQAGSLDLSEAVNYIVKATNAAGIGFEDMSDFIDLWTFAANSSASTVGEFGDAMLRMGSTMRFAANPEELMTLIAVTADAGSVGSEAGTMIRNSIIRLVAPTQQATEAMEELGVTSEEMSDVLDDEALAAANAELAARGFSAFDQNGELRPVLDIYGDLSDALADIAGGYDKISTDEDALRILSAIFPTRTITEALNLLNATADGYGGLYDAMREGAAEGYGEYAADTMLDTLNGSIEIFDSKVERLKQLVGEELKGQVEGAAGFVGEIVDGIAELDQDDFGALVRGVEAIALAGPGLLTAGGIFRIIGLVFGTKGGAIAGAALALAAGAAALSKYSDIRFENKFGDMDVDVAALKQNLESLTTEGEENLGQLQGFVDEVSRLAGEYETAAGKFSQEISLATLTGKELTDAEQRQLVQYGESMIGAVMQGINTKREESLTFLNLITPDDMFGEEWETYSDTYDLLDGFFDGLEGEAKEVGAQLQQAITAGLKDDGTIDEDERAVIQSYVDKLNRIQAQIAAQTDQAAYYSELEKAQRVSKDSIDEYLGELETSNAQRLENVDAMFAEEMGYTRAQYEAEQGRALTDEEWQATPQYRLISGEWNDYRAQVENQTGQLARTAFQSLMNDSELGEAFAFAQQVLREAPREANGAIAFDKIDWSRYTQEQMNQFTEGYSGLMRGGGFLGLGENEFRKMLEPFANVPGVADLYSMFGQRGDIATLMSFMQTWQQSGGQSYEMSVTTDVDDTAMQNTIAAAEAGVRMPVAVTEYQEGTNAAESLQGQGVSVSVSGDTTDLSATIDAENGRELLSYVDGDATGLSMAITAEDGRNLTEYVTGDVSDLQAKINSFQGRTVTVRIVGQNFLGGVGTARSGGIFAEGGRADTASIFGEAGPEWAIPEEHTARTAALLNEARAASGFTWSDLISAAGSSGAGTASGPATVVYSPVINAQDARGVESVLQDDHARFRKWWEEQRRRDAMEVYA